MQEWNEVETELSWYGYMLLGIIYIKRNQINILLKYIYNLEVNEIFIYHPVTTYKIPELFVIQIRKS